MTALGMWISVHDRIENRRKLSCQRSILKPIDMRNIWSNELLLSCRQLVQEYLDIRYVVWTTYPQSMTIDQIGGRTFPTD
jgi:hypothetical protein